MSLSPAALRVHKEFVVFLRPRTKNNSSKYAGLRVCSMPLRVPGEFVTFLRVNLIYFLLKIVIRM